MLEFWNLELLERKFKQWFLYGVSYYILMVEFWNLEHSNGNLSNGFDMVYPTIY